MGRHDNEIEATDRAGKPYVAGNTYSFPMSKLRKCHTKNRCHSFTYKGNKRVINYMGENEFQFLDDKKTPTLCTFGYSKNTSIGISKVEYQISFVGKIFEVKLVL